MNHKILKLLTGISAFAVAGLLSIVPAGISRATTPPPSASPSGTGYTPFSVTTNATLSIRDLSDPMLMSEPPSADLNVTLIWTFYDLPNTITFTGGNHAQFYILSATEQNFRMTYGGTIAGGDVTQDPYGTLEVGFTYNGTNYFCGISVTPLPTNALQATISGIDETNNYVAPTPSAPPAASPSATPSAEPSAEPSAVPSVEPSQSPSEVPSAEPSVEPSETPSAEPSAVPSLNPSQDPSFPPLNPENPADKSFLESINKIVKEIENASDNAGNGQAGSSATVGYSCNTAISARIIYALAHSKNVTLIYTFEYQGIVFRSSITSEKAAEIYDPEILWYGPCFIAKKCPTVPIGLAK